MWLLVPQYSGAGFLPGAAGDHNGYLHPAARAHSWRNQPGHDPLSDPIERGVLEQRELGSRGRTMGKVTQVVTKPISLPLGNELLPITPGKPRNVANTAGKPKSVSASLGAAT